MAHERIGDLTVMLTRLVHRAAALATVVAPVVALALFLATGRRWLP